MGKRNWLFTSTEVGARRVGVIQSLIITCRLHDVDPYTYLVDVLQRIGDHRAKDVAELIPRVWKSRFAHDPLPSALGHHAHHPPPHWRNTRKYVPVCPVTAKRQFADFMRELVSALIERWTVRVLEASGEGAFSEFGRIVIQDGSSFAVHDALAHRYPGRFRARCPAAVELHVTMDLLQDRAAKVTLTADTAPERPHLPAAHTLEGDLLLADRGYFERGYLREVGRAGGHYVVRGKTSLNPVVQAAFAVDGLRLRGVRAKRLKAVRISKKGLVDFDVVWGKGGRAFSARLIASWNRSKRECRFLVINLPRSRYRAKAVDQAYRLRWQIELLFKEWKSYANLHAFNTANPAIAEGLVWAAIGAAAMKRYLAHLTQVLQGVQVSTRKVAMCPSGTRQSHRRIDFKIP